MYNLQFQYPQALWLLLALPLFLLIYILYIYRKKKAVKKIGDPALVKQLFKNHSSFKQAVKFIFLFFTFAFGCIAVANPRRAEEGTNDVRKGIDIVLALDVSNSMLATDVTPNRLAKAKDFISGLLQRMPDNRVALVVFAGHAYIQMPLTYDHNAARMFIASASPALIAAQGTALSEALQKSEIAFNTSEERYKSILLISDGETHDAEAVQTATQLATTGILINTIGVGSEQGGNIIDPITKAPKKDASGNVVLSRLDEQTLRQIAEATKGEYILLNNTTTAINQLETQLATAEKKAFVDLSLLNYTSFYWWFAIPMLFFLLIEIYVGDRKKQTT
jgi:Ca-activated chloride channel family protein